MKPRRMMRHARKIPVQQSLYIKRTFKWLYWMMTGCVEKLLSLSATKRFL